MKKLCCLIGALFMTASAMADFTFVEEGGAPCAILYRDDAPKHERDAAVELANYLKRISGAPFVATAAPEALPPRAVLVGGLTAEIGKGLRADGFALKTQGETLHIVGGNPGLSYGVYEVLQRLGCRFWSHNEEDIPHSPTLRLPELDLASQSPFTLHDIMSREASLHARKSRMTGVENFTGSHTLQPMLKSYSGEHPEILPLNKKTGERKFNNLHYCYLAPGIAAALAAELEKVVAARNGNLDFPIYFAGMGDWYGGMCQCPACEAAYADEAWTDPDGRVKPGYSATLIQMFNQVAAILEPKYPGIKIGTFAYMSLEAPPAKTIPAANVHIRVPRLRHCTVHAADECDNNASFRRNLERWCEIAPNRVYIWDYGVNYASFLYPFPCINSIAANIRYYHRLGVRGVMIQGNYVTTGGDLVVLRNYLWSRLLWNPDLDLATLLSDFCHGYYGPAAAPMLSYVKHLEEAVRAPEMIHADEFVKKAAYLKPPARRALHELRQEALAAANGTEPFVRRVREATVGLEILALDNEQPLMAVGSQLVKANADGPTWERALDAAANCRDAGATEWNNGRSYWLNLIAAQGGPLYHLTNATLSATVAPLVYGQLRQVEYKGKPLFATNSVTLGCGSHLGGQIIRGGPFPMQAVDTPGAASLKMQYRLEAGKWRHNVNENIWQAITLSAADTLTVTGLVARGAQPGTFTVDTFYPAGDITKMAVACRDPEGQWQPVALEREPDQPKQKSRGDIATIPRAAAVRLTLPQQQLGITDSYGVGEITDITVLHEKARKRLLISVRIKGTDKIKDAGPLPFFTRTLHIGETPPQAEKR